MGGRFDRYVGVDFSGAGGPDRPSPRIRMYVADRRGEPVELRTDVARRKHWSRRGLFAELKEILNRDERVLVGLDFAFSYPESYFDEEGLDSWEDFLEYVDDRFGTRNRSVEEAFNEVGEPSSEDNFRLTERWTSSTKSVFNFEVQGQVAKATLAGIPWLRHLREEVEGLKFWPFEAVDSKGWEELPGGASIVAEVYPSILSRRYDAGGRTGDQQDAYAVARWLREVDEDGSLDRYLRPPVADDELGRVAREGWILGIC